MSPIHQAEPPAGGLEAVFLSYRAALIGFVRSRGAGDDAEDVIQELWTRLGRGGIGPIADPLAYLYRMADNLMIDRMRSAMRRRHREDMWRGANEAGRSEAADQPGAERRLIARQQLDLIDARLGELGERTLAIFRRYRLDGIGQQQIAAEFDISLSAVEKHLQKVYRELRAIRREEAAGTEPSRRLPAEGATDGER